MEAYLPYILTGSGLLLLFLAWNGIKRKAVRGTYGTQDTRDPRYYLRIGGYILGALLLLTLAGVEFAQRYGTMVLGLFGGGTGLLVWLFLRIPPWLTKVRERATQPIRTVKEKRAERKQPKEPVVAPEVKQWPLAAIAFLSRLRNWQDLTLEQAGQSKRAAKKYLLRDWEIENESDFDEIQDWLFETGHRKDFYAFVNAIEQMSDEGLLLYVQEVGTGQRTFADGADPEEVLHRIKLIREDASILRMNGFMAWDLLRYIDNCRLGFLAGYIDMERAAADMHKASQVLQSRFSSWRELADNFLLGREFWSVRSMREDGAVYRNHISRLFDDPESPWHEIPFNLALSR